MERRNGEIIDAKINALRSESDTIFDKESLRHIFFKSEHFREKFNPFLEKLGHEIKSLPRDNITEHHIDYWVELLNKKISTAQRVKKLSEIGRIFLTHRKKLRTHLLQIKTDLISTPLTLPKASPVADSPALSFQSIFSKPDWKPYINVLYQVHAPVINKEYEFIGRPQKHKGVVCSWIKYLQSKNIIHKKYNRQELALVLNKEIKGLGLGKDGKTLDVVSATFENEYKPKLVSLIKSLP